MLGAPLGYDSHHPRSGQQITLKKNVESVADSSDSFFNIVEQQRLPEPGFSLRGEDNVQNGQQTQVPFKLSRDYSFEEEGFEDWSFLYEDRPYDSLVRENIFELLEHLETGENNDLSLPVSSTMNDDLASISGYVPMVEEDDDEMVRFSDNLGWTPFEEHVSSSEIHQTYSNRLRLEQRMKWFYGLKTKAMFQKSILRSNGRNEENNAASIWAPLLKLEDRADIQIFRLNWATSLASARQLLKHKHFGITRQKDRNVRDGTSQGNNGTMNASVVGFKTKSLTSNIFIQKGDLLYWMTRDIRIADNTAEGMDNEASSTKKSGIVGVVGKNGRPSQGNSHQFPWGIYTSISESPTPDFIVDSLDMEAPMSESNVRDGTSQGNTTEDIFLIPTQNAQLTLDSCLHDLFLDICGDGAAKGAVTDGDDGLRAEFSALRMKQISQKSGHKNQTTFVGCDLKQVSYYFETHYDLMYVIRSPDKPIKKYLSLPQSIIHKNEWKNYLESSI